jgi:hypothetical protein
VLALVQIKLNHIVQKYDLSKETKVQLNHSLDNDNLEGMEKQMSTMMSDSPIKSSRDNSKFMFNSNKKQVQLSRELKHTVSLPTIGINESSSTLRSSRIRSNKQQLDSMSPSSSVTRQGMRVTKLKKRLLIMVS